jgi:hypothetical protein
VGRLIKETKYTRRDMRSWYIRRMLRKSTVLAEITTYYPFRTIGDGAGPTWIHKIHEVLELEGKSRWVRRS